MNDLTPLDQQEVALIRGLSKCSGDEQSKRLGTVRRLVATIDAKDAEIARWKSGTQDQVREIERLKAYNRLHRDKAAGEYWAWQGDGEDRLESLTCPVLIPAAELLRLQGQANAVEDALAAMRIELEAGKE